MPTARKVLGASKPGAATDATLYTVPAATDTVVSTITVAETGGATATFRITVDSAGGAVTTASKTVAWNVALAANQTLTFTLGITIQAAGTIVVQASTANVCFMAFGQENS